MSSLRFLFSISISLVVTLAPATADVLWYANDFEGSGPVGPEWSTPQTDTTPGSVAHPADKFLGQFSNEEVVLTLNNLPAHAEVTLTFDLYIIRSWDGNYSADPDIGPDFWGIDGGVIPDQWDWYTTFSNWDGVQQSFPDQYPADNDPRQGYYEKDTLGYQFYSQGQWIDQDTVYRRTIPMAHSDSTLEITFGALGLQEITDESWGLDNVFVELDVPEPGTLLLLLIGGLATQLRKRSVTLTVIG